jgi:hypothetical protein
MLKATRWLGFVGMIFVLLSGIALAKGAASTTPKVHGPKATTAKGSAAVVKASTTKAKGSSTTPKTTTSKGSTTKLAKSTTPKGNSASAKTKGGVTTTTQSGLTTTSNTTSSSTGSTTASTTGTATWTPDNPVAQKLSTKSNLMKKAQNVIGAGVDLNGATSGFKNFGQFVAAVNVSNNHQIAFADLKAAMTGLDIKGQPVVTTSATGATTPASTLSLGQAIQKLKTGVDGETVAQGALIQADAEINSSSTTTSTSTSTSTTTTTTTTKAKSKTP